MTAGAVATAPAGRGTRGGGGGPLLANHEKAIRPRGTTDSEDAARAEAHKSRRDQRYALREVLWQHSTIRRVTFCGRIAAKGKRANPVTPEIRMADGVAYYAGVARCGSVWACPVCSTHIRHERSMEVEAGMRRWLEEGNQVLFLTLTMPHGLGDSCAELMETIKEGWRKLMGSGRPWRRDRDRFRIAHTFRSWDATHGENGWHPHLHAALFVEGQLPEEELAALRASLYHRWADGVEERGHRRPSEEHGVHLETARGATDLSRYLLKVTGEESGSRLALELTRGDLKSGGGRTPFQILAGFRETGDLADLRLFQEWEKATKGQHFTRWSRGAKDALAVVEKSDEEIVEEEVGGETIYVPTPEEWLAACRTRGAQSRMLRIAEEQGEPGVRHYLTGIAARWRRRRRHGREEDPPGGR